MGLLHFILPLLEAPSHASRHQPVFWMVVLFSKCSAGISPNPWSLVVPNPRSLKAQIPEGLKKHLKSIGFSCRELYMRSMGSKTRWVGCVYSITAG